MSWMTPSVVEAAFCAGWGCSCISKPDALMEHFILCNGLIEGG